MITTPHTETKDLSINTLVVKRREMIGGDTADVTAT